MLSYIASNPATSLHRVLELVQLYRALCYSFNLPEYPRLIHLLFFSLVLDQVEETLCLLPSKIFISSTAPSFFFVFTAERDSSPYLPG